MALTQQQIEEMDKITGLTGANIQKSRVGELQALRQKVVENKPQKDTFMEKVAGFTGGKQLAQGLGQGLANSGFIEKGLKIGGKTIIESGNVAKQQEQALNDAITQQTELLKRKKEIEALGGDTTAIDKGLEYNKQSLDEISGGMEGLLNQKDITGKQVIGSALQLGGTIIGAGTVGSGASAVSKATTAGQGALAGLKAGAASGAIYGGTSGVAKGLQEDGDALEIAQKGLGGAITGAALGGALGAAGGAITGKIKGKAIAQAVKKDTFAQKLVMPEETADVIEKASKQQRIKGQTWLKKGEIMPSNFDKKLKGAVEDIVNPKLSIQENSGIISKELTDINNNLKSLVKKYKVPVNTNQITSKLNSGKDELKLIFASDKQAEKTYNAVVKEYLKHVKSKDTFGIFEARQEFDKIPAIKKLLDSQGLGENAKREIVSTVRTKANEYVAELLPKGNKYREALLKESYMMEAMENIANKVRESGIVGRNKFQSLVKAHPWLKAAAAIVVGGIGVGGYGALAGRGE